MTFPPPPPSTHSSIASSTEKSSAARLSRPQQHSVWGTPGSQSGLRRGLTPLTTTNFSSTTAASPSRRPPSIEQPRCWQCSTISPLVYIFSCSQLRQPLGMSPPNLFPASVPQFSTRLHSQQHTVHSVSSPKSRALTPSAGSQLAGNISGGGSGGRRWVGIL